MTPVFFDSKLIMEIKFNDHLPNYIKNIACIDSFEKSAISKYTLSRSYFRKNIWEDH